MSSDDAPGRGTPPRPVAGPGFWQRAAAEDSGGNDIDAGRIIALAGGLAIVAAIFAVAVVILVRQVDLVQAATAIGILGGALTALLTGAGAYMLMKGKGEGQPT